MRISVLTGPGGRVLATIRHPEQKAGERSLPRTGLIAAPKQRLHEIELPGDLEDIQSAEEFHRALKKHLAKKSSRS
jgi:hypothetical protein